MKRFIAIGVGTLSVALTARAQWAVYDAANHAQQIVNGAQEIAKFVEMINNQVQQIDRLTEQVNTLNHYVDLFGDPNSVAPASMGFLTAELRRTELGETLLDLRTSVDPIASMLDDGGGLFHVIGEDFTTPGGTTIARRQGVYRPVAAVQKTTGNYLNVSANAVERRAALKAEIASTTDALKAAKTDAEVQKLTGVLVGLSAALDSSDHEVSQATASALVQDIANRADERRQIDAKKEQQHAEFTEAVDKYAKTFRLMNAPVNFPTE
jgi:hypothetical protein